MSTRPKAAFALALVLLAAAVAGVQAQTRRKRSSSAAASSGGSNSDSGSGSVNVHGNNQPPTGEGSCSGDACTRGAAGRGGWKANYDTPPEVFGVYRSSRYVGDGAESGERSGGQRSGDDGGKEGRSRDDGSRRRDSSSERVVARPTPNDPNNGPPGSSSESSGPSAEPVRSDRAAASPAAPPAAPLLLTEEEARANFESAIQAEAARCGDEHCFLRDSKTREGRRARLAAVDSDSVTLIKDGVYQGLARFEGRDKRVFEARMTVDMSGDLWRVTTVEFEPSGKKAPPKKAAGAAKPRQKS